MNVIIKTFEVSYIYGTTINPEVRKIKISIEGNSNLTEDYIRYKIITERPNQKNQIGDILSVILIDEKIIEKKEEVTKPPVFNW